MVALVGRTGQPGEDPEGEDRTRDHHPGVGHDGREGVAERPAQGTATGGGAAERVRLVVGGRERVLGADDRRVRDGVELGAQGLRVAQRPHEVAARDAAEPGEPGRDRPHRRPGQRCQQALVAQVEDDPARARVDRLEQTGDHSAAERVAQRAVEPDPEPLTGGADPGVRLGLQRGAEHPGAAGHDAADGVAAERGDRGEHPLDGAEGQVHRVGGSARGDGEERGDRPGLEQRDLTLRDGPLEVLRAAVLLLDAPAQVHEGADVVVGQRRLRAALAVARLDPTAGLR